MAGKRKADSAAVRAEKVRRTRKHYVNVFQSSKATYSTARVLAHMMFVCGDFYEPRCRVSKKQLAEDLSLNRQTIQLALRFLKAEGTIYVEHGEKGGRIEGGYGLAPTYRFRAVGEGASSAPRDTDDSGGGELMAAILAAFEDRPAFAEQWIEPLAVAGIERGTLTIIAPSDFHRGQVEQPHGEAILSAAAAHDPTIKKLRFST